MELILWRHAEAREGTPDLTRELTAKGRRHAQKMGAWLTEHLPDRTRIITSPATRTLQTVAALTAEAEVVQSVAPGASYKAVLAAANWPRSTQAVLVVGHQPTLGQLVSMLLFDSAADFAIKKGAVVWLSNRTREERSEVVLRAVMSCDML